MTTEASNLAANLTQSPPSSPLRAVGAGFFAGLRHNKRLVWGIAIILGIILLDFSLRGLDIVNAKRARVAELQADYVELKQQIKQTRDQESILKTARIRRAQFEQRLIHAGSEASAQARMLDWANDLLRENKFPANDLKISGAKKITAPPDVNLQIYELRTLIRIPFTPANLSRILSQIEGGEDLVNLESLKVSQRTRIAELGVRMLIKIPPIATTDEK